MVESGVDVFISYASSDLRTALELKRALKLRHLSVFIDRRSINPSDKWPQALAFEIDRCRSMVVLLPATAPGRWQTNEIIAAQDRLKRDPSFNLTPVRLSDNPMPTETTILLGGSHLYTVESGSIGVHRLAEHVKRALGHTRQADGPQCLAPWKGLEPYTSSDRARFFGREKTSARLAQELLTTKKILQICGASGVGKSSFLRAGLVAHLRADFATNEAVTCRSIDTRPGASPLENLARALLANASGIPLSTTIREGIADLIRSEPARILNIFPQVPGTRIVILVDQLEELFTAEVAPTDRVVYLEALAAIARAPELDVRVVAAIRSDFLDQLDISPRYVASLNIHKLAPLSTREELLPIIVGPAAVAGLRWEDEDRFPMEIAAEVSGEPGAISLLSFALAKLFAHKGPGDVLTRSAFHELGGISGLIDRTADATADALPKELANVADMVLGHLVYVDDEPGARLVGRTVPLDHLLALDSGMERVQEVLHMLDSQPPAGSERLRLVIVDRDTLGTPTVRLVHDLLISVWGRLSIIAAQLPRDQRLRQELEREASRWNRGGRLSDALRSGALLKQAEQWRRRNPEAGANTVLDQYIRTSSETEARRIRRRKHLQVGLALVAALALVTALLALEARQDEAQARAAAEASREKLRNAGNKILIRFHSALATTEQSELLEELLADAREIFEVSESSITMAQIDILRKQARIAYTGRADHEGALRLQKQAVEYLLRRWQASDTNQRFLVGIELSTAYSELAEIHNVMRQPAAANEAALRAIALVDREVRRGGRVLADAAMASAMAYERYGLSLLQVRESKKGIEALQYSLELWRTAELQDSAHVRNQAVLHQQLGRAYRDARQQNEAVEAYRESYALFRELSSEEPTNYQHRLDLAIAAHFLGISQSEQGDFEDSIATLEGGVELARDLVEADPHNDRAKLVLVEIRSSLAKRVAGRDRPRAISLLRQSVTLLESCGADGARIKELRARLASGWGILARLLVEAQPDEAIRAFSVGIEVAQTLAREHADDPTGRELEVGLLLERGEVELRHLPRHRGVAMTTYGTALDKARSWSQWASRMKLPRRYTQARVMTWRTLLSMGDAYEAASRQAMARRAFAEALDVANDLAHTDAEPIEHQERLAESAGRIGRFEAKYGRLADADRYWVLQRTTLDALSAREPERARWRIERSRSCEDELARIGAAHRERISGLTECAVVNASLAESLDTQGEIRVWIEGRTNHIERALRMLPRNQGSQLLDRLERRAEAVALRNPGAAAGILRSVIDAPTSVELAPELVSRLARRPDDVLRKPGGRHQCPTARALLVADAPHSEVYAAASRCVRQGEPWLLEGLAIQLIVTVLDERTTVSATIGQALWSAYRSGESLSSWKMKGMVDYIRTTNSRKTEPIIRALDVLGARRSQKSLRELATALGLLVDSDILPESCAQGEGGVCWWLARDAKRVGDQESSVNYFLAGCEHGDWRSCVEVGKTLEAASKAGRPDLAKQAAAVYARACRNDWQRGCAHFAVMEWRGSGAERDQWAAHAKFVAACGTVAFACRWAGHDLMHGIGVGKNDEAAVVFFRRGCEKEDGESCRRAGGLLSQLLGGSARSEALSFYQRACELKVGAGCTMAGLAHRSGRGVKPDSERAAELFSDGCRLGDGAGCWRLGLAYRDARGVERDYVRMKALAQQGCDLGDMEGCLLLGNAFGLGRGVQQNRSRATKLYLQACEGQVAIACRNVGTTFRDGIGVAVDVRKGSRYLRMACDLGDGVACRLLAEWIERRPKPDRVKVGDLLRVGCGLGDATSCTRSEAGSE